MNRRKVNSLAAIITLMGAFHIAAPPPASATEAAEACCDGKLSDCCGDECRVDQYGNCTYCTGWRCIFF